MNQPGVVLVVGSANVDFTVRVPRLPGLGETLLGESGGKGAGGKGLNQAIASASCGALTRFYGGVGRDAEGDFLATTLAAAGVHAQLERADTPTGIAHIVLLPGGENSIMVASGANGTLAPSGANEFITGHAAAAVPRNAGAGTAAVSTVSPESARQIRVVLVQAEIPVETVRAALLAGRKIGATTVLNAAPANPELFGLLDLVDVLIVNQNEAQELGGTSALVAVGGPLVVRTMGAAGAELLQAGQDPVLVRAYPVESVDTTGAGDAFCGALAAGLAAGLELRSALDWASAAGAIATTETGAQAPGLSPHAVSGLLGGR